MKNHSPGFLAIVADAKTRVEEMDVPSYLAMREAGEDHLLIDVREESEFAAGHVTGAIHLSKGVIERDIEERIPEKEKTLILYCGGGYRSALVADNLRQMGYLRPVTLDGGWRALKETGLELENGAQALKD